MEVMAACLRVALANRPDPTWTPAPGRLFVRISCAPWQHEITFCFADGERHHQTIARIRNWRAEPYFGGWTELTKGDFDTTSAACATIRRDAEEADVDALVKLWASDGAKTPPGWRCTIAQWLERVCESELCDDDKAMIARVVKSAGAPTP